MKFTKIVRPMGDLSLDETIMELPDGIVVTIVGAGTADYRVHVAFDWKTCPDCETLTRILSDLGVVDGWFPSGTFGTAAVWYSDTTFAHVIWDYIMGQ